MSLHSILNLNELRDLAPLLMFYLIRHMATLHQMAVQTAVGIIGFHRYKYTFSDDFVGPLLFDSVSVELYSSGRRRTLAFHWTIYNQDRLLYRSRMFLLPTNKEMVFFSISYQYEIYNCIFLWMMRLINEIFSPPYKVLLMVDGLMDSLRYRLNSRDDVVRRQIFTIILANISTRRVDFGPRRYTLCWYFCPERDMRRVAPAGNLFSRRHVSTS